MNPEEFANDFYPYLNRLFPALVLTAEQQDVWLTTAKYLDLAAARRCAVKLYQTTKYREPTLGEFREIALPEIERAAWEVRARQIRSSKTPNDSEVDQGVNR